jgi:PAS domain S-box-containing protein
VKLHNPNRTEDALRNAALAVSTAAGEGVFRELVRALATILDVEVAFIALPKPGDSCMLSMLAYYADGRMIENFEYAVAGTPCETVVGQEFRCYPSGVAERFPLDKDFREMEGYAGYPLTDARGESAGLMVVASRRPIEAPELIESVLKIFAARAMVELERRRAEAALQASEEQYRAIFNASEDALVLWNSSLRRVDVNTAYERLYGWKREEVIGYGYESLGVPAQFSEPRLDLVRRTLAGETCRVELESVRKNGERFQADIRTIPFMHRGERHVLTIARDITERRARDEALRASEEQYRAIFNASFDSMIIRTLDGEIVDVNPALESMYDYTREELIGRTFGPIIPEKLAGPYRAYLAEVAAGRPVRTETRLPRKDGSYVDIEVLGSLVTYHGKPHVLSVARDMTERRARDEALRASEEQYRAVFNATTDGLVLRDAELRLVDVNPALLAMTGFTRAETIGQERVLFAPPELHDRVRDAYRRALAGEHVVYESDAMRRDGTRFEVEMRYLPIQYQGRPHVLAIARDITERKRAEQAMRASEEQYRAIFNATDDALVLWDSSLRRVDVNSAYERLYGWRRDEVVEQRDFEWRSVTREYSDRRLELVRRSLAGETCHVELESERKNGERFQADVRTIPFMHRGERHVLTIVHDVTERRRREEALRASEEQYRAIFNASFDGMIIRTLEGEIVDVNPALLAMYGYERDDLIGKTFGPIIPEQRAASFRGYLAEVASGRPYRTESKVPRKDGSKVYIEVLGSPVTYKGRPHVLSVVRDITARRELEAQLRQAQKMEAIGHLTGGIAHDFNNILTGIMGYLTLASEREAAQADAKLARHLQQAQHGASRARELIQQMLAFSRAQKGKPRAVALAPLVEDAVRLLGSSLPSTVELSTALDTDAPAVMIDPVQVEQILLNLCINARDAMDGAGRIRVSVSTAAHAGGAVCASCHQALNGRYVELRVTDTGPGIAPHVMERMFEPFFTTKEVGRGSGMGLSTVHGIVHEHGGHVAVDTAPGKGAAFSVLLPALAAEVDAAVPADAPGAARKPLRQALEGRVLLVDDEQMVVDFMAELLGGWGLEVTVHRNPAEAEAWLASDPARIDVLLTDQTMPKMTGLELARRAGALRAGLPVILYSGFAENIGADQLARSGVRALLRKPVEPGPLFAALAEALRR